MVLYLYGLLPNSHSTGLIVRKLSDIFYSSKRVKVIRRNKNLKTRKVGENATHQEDSQDNQMECGI